MQKLLVVLAAVLAVVLCECPQCPAPKLTFIKEIIICEREQSSLMCPFGTTIQVHEAFYGRKDARTCVHPSATDGSNVHEVCTSPNALEAVRNRCNGHRECDLASANTWLVDPCRKTYKYLEVAFSCVKGELGKVWEN